MKRIAVIICVGLVAVATASTAAARGLPQNVVKQARAGIWRFDQQGQHEYDIRCHAMPDFVVACRTKLAESYTITSMGDPTQHGTTVIEGWDYLRVCSKGLCVFKLSSGTFSLPASAVLPN